MHVFPLNRPLCPRLQMVADFVRDGAAVADIGTDHAYLPVALVLSGKCPRAVVSDLREMPLENARQAIRRYHLEDRIVACRMGLTKLLRIGRRILSLPGWAAN